MITVSMWLCHTARTFLGLLVSKLANLEQNLSQETLARLTRLGNRELLHWLGLRNFLA